MRVQLCLAGAVLAVGASSASAGGVATIAGSVLAVGASSASAGGVATIAGSVRACGGPAAGGCRVQALTICQVPGTCATPTEVVVVDPHRRRVATQGLRHARFSLRVPPGIYTVELHSNHGRVLEHQPVRARAQQTATVTFTFVVP